jgi:hypothetical protein
MYGRQSIVDSYHGLNGPQTKVWLVAIDLMVAIDSIGLSRFKWASNKGRVGSY